MFRCGHEESAAEVTVTAQPLLLEHDGILFAQAMQRQGEANDLTLPGAESLATA